MIDLAERIDAEICRQGDYDTDSLIAIIARHAPAPISTETAVLIAGDTIAARDAEIARYRAALESVVNPWRDGDEEQQMTAFEMLEYVRADAREALAPPPAVAIKENVK
jgi:predicted lipid-binding transport protein (Tim44 family)